MITSHQFGGDWTDEKLERLKRYLVEYTKIFAKNEKAKNLITYYIDAFAGTGSRAIRSMPKTGMPSLLEEDDVFLDDQDATSFTKGSARIALELEHPFKRYVFVEQKAEHVRELEKLKQEFPTRKIEIEQEDANVFLQNWCDQVDREKNRSVVFLDPYGMSVDWKTIELLAETKIVDLWLLFPLGQGVNRLLTRNGPPKGAWADKLTKFFGTNEWETEFYLTLRNSKNVPIFLLCFASSNPKGAPTAVRIADYILRK